MHAYEGEVASKWLGTGRVWLQAAGGKVETERLPSFIPLQSLMHLQTVRELPVGLTPPVMPASLPACWASTHWSGEWRLP